MTIHAPGNFPGRLKRAKHSCQPAWDASLVCRAGAFTAVLLLAGAVAFYALLSIVPLLILMVIAPSHVIAQDVLLATLRRALEYLVPGEGKAVVVELRAFLDHREVIGWVLLITMSCSPWRRRSSHPRPRRHRRHGADDGRGSRP